MGKSMEEINNWEDVDRCLKEIGECEITIKCLEADAQRRINDVRTEADKLGQPLQKTINQLKEQIQSFAEDRKSELSGKTKKLTFGRIGYRQTGSIIIPAKKMKQVIHNLRRFGMKDCINTKETINKEILKRYSDADIVQIGASKKIEDKFWCKAIQETIKG